MLVVLLSTTFFPTNKSYLQYIFKLYDVGDNDGGLCKIISPVFLIFDHSACAKCNYAPYDNETTECSVYWEYCSTTGLEGRFNLIVSLFIIYVSTVQRVYNGYWREPENIPYMWCFPLYTGSNCMQYSLNGENETALYSQWFATYRCSKADLIDLGLSISQL
jgi:hypothetical protein